MVSGAINFTRYVDIISGVGANGNVPQRQLIGRVFTDNNLLPPHSFIEFSSADDVGTYFGFTSVEYKRALFYFTYISPSIKAAKKISFARWVDSDVGSLIYGKVGTYLYSQFSSITNGGFTLNLGGFSHALAGIDLSAAVSLAGVATAMQTAIRAYTAGGAAWTGATVSYDATNKRFNFVSGAVGDDVISATAPVSGTDLLAPLGWVDADGAIFANGSDAQTISACLAESAGASNNFGSFLFMPNLTTDQITEAATWNASQNVMYQYMVPVTIANRAAVNTAIVTLAGSDMTLVDPTNYPTDYDEMIPMIQLAATDYLATQGVQNYMFKQFSGITPKVTTDAEADTCDALRVNYYGQTQTAGQFIAFYQRGQMTGVGTAPTDQNVYANEQWFKDYAGSQIMQLLLSLSKVSANKQGRAQLTTVLLGVAALALKNGTISVGKDLTTVQKLYISNATGDDKAWYQVQNTGYWLDVAIVPFVDLSGATEYKAIYTFIYSKDDDIRKVEGSHILI